MGKIKDPDRPNPFVMAIGIGLIIAGLVLLLEKIGA